MYDLDSDDEQKFIQWQQSLAAKKVIYESYSENLKRAIDELELFYFPKNKQIESLDKLKDIFIDARKIDYANKNVTHNIEISDEDFKIALEHWDIKSITKSNKIYFKCSLNQDVKDVLKENKNLFIFTDDNHKYNNIDIINCDVCNLAYDKKVGCKKVNTKDHQYRQWTLDHNLTISKYAWEKEYWKK
jgi:hypothetical protein